MQKVKNAPANEIRALKRMKDQDIDTTDIPPVLDWSKAVVGKFYGQSRNPSRSGWTRTCSPGSKDKAEVIRRESTPFCEARWRGTGRDREYIGGLKG